MQASRSRATTPDASVHETCSVSSRSPSEKSRCGITQAIAVVALSSVVSLAHASPTTYTLNPLIGVNGSMLTGTITIDDADNNGAIVASEIVAWSFTSTGVVSFSFSSGTLSAGSQCLGSPGGLSVTPTTLSFNFGSVVPNDPFVVFFSPGNAFELLETAQGGSESVVWNSPGPGHVDRGHWPSNVIATAPEPVGVRARTWSEIKLLYR